MNEQHLTTSRLIDYLHGELAVGEDVAVLAHLEACSDCRAAHEAEARLNDLLRAHARATERELPQGVVARIWDQVERESERPAWWTQLSALLRPIVAVPVAAGLVLAVYVGVTLHPGNIATTIDAAYYLDDHAALTRTVPFSEGGSAVPASLQSGADGNDSLVAAADVSTVNAQP